MNQQISPPGMLCNRSMICTAILFMIGSVIMLNTFSRNLLLKELFCCWLLVFINAYIGTFIANQAIKRDFTGFMVWAFLINGLRVGLFLILLLSVVQWGVYNVRAFVLMTFFGYFTFLAVEIHGLLKHTRWIAENQQCSRKDD